MLNQFYFYFHQGRTAIKKSILTLIAIGLAVSLISGVNYYIDSYQSQMLEESFQNPIDFAIYDRWTTSTSNNMLSQSNLNELNNYLIDSNIEPSALNPYIHDTGSYSLEVNFSGYSYYPDYYISSENFFTSNTFQKYFYRTEGNFPTLGTEIMLPEDLGNFFNFSVGDPFLLPYNTSRYTAYNYNSTFEYQLNFTICGFYLPTQESIRLNHENYWFDTLYDPVSETKEVIDNSFSMYRNDLLFSSLEWNNFTEEYDIHPVQTMISHWSQLKNAIDNNYDIYIHGYYAGFNGNIDRSRISYRNIINTIRDFQKSEDLLYKKLSSPTSNYKSYRFRFYLIDNLEDFLLETRLIRLLLQIFNVPIILCALYIALFSIRMNTKERQQEFLLLRSKGIPRKMIRRQFLIQSIMVGVISGTIGIVGGMGIFHIVKSFFDQFFEVILTRSLNLRIGPFSIIYNYLVGIGLLLISSIPSIRFINGKETNQLLGTLGAEYLDVEYDERTLFIPQAKNEVTLQDTPFLRKKKTHPNKPSINGALKKSRFNRKGKTKVYQNQIKKKEKKILKYGIYLVIFSLIPLLTYFIYLFSQLPFAPDRLVLFVENTLVPYYDYMYIFSVFSPIFLVYGLIRFFVKENPSRFARVIKKLSHPFVKGKDFLISLNMVKQKAYIRFMVISGLFCSLLVFSNITLTSLEKYELVADNYDIGADVKVGLSENAYYDYNFTNKITPAIIEERDALIEATEDNKNESFINNVITSIELRTYSWSGENSQESHIYIDIPAYFDMITESDKDLPSRSFKKKIESIKTYFAKENPEYPGIVVTQDFSDVYKKGEGDIVSIVDYYFNSTTQDIAVYQQEVQVVATLPFFPGLHQGSQNWWGFSTGILLNLSSFPDVNGSLEFDAYDYETVNVDEQFLSMYQFYDVTMESMENITKLDELLSQNEYNWYDTSRYQFYKYPGISQEEEPYDYGPTPTTFYNLIYLEFFIIGGILALTLALITLGIQRQNKYENGVYLSRGLGWKGLLKLVITQISIVFAISLGFGIISGLMSGSILLTVIQQTGLDYPGLSLPIYGDIWDITWLLGSIILITYLAYISVFYFETKKNIRDYFPQF